MLRELEQCTGKRIHELFDLICGTSTGGILAASLALQQFTLSDVQDIYRFSPLQPSACAHHVSRSVTLADQHLHRWVFLLHWTLTHQDSEPNFFLELFRNI